jgi:hypothetical protein
VDNFKTMAISGAAFARQFGVSLKELLAVSEKFATFGAAAENVGKLNAVMGLNLNTSKMLMATETERADILRRELMASGKSWQNMNRFQREAIVNMTGWNYETAQAVLSTGKSHKSLEQLRKEQEKRAKQQRTDKQLQREANKALSDMAHILDRFFGWSGKILETWIKLGKVLSPVLLPFRKLLIDLMDVLIDRFEEWDMKEWGKKITASLEKIFPVGKKLLNWFLDMKWESASNMMDGATSILDQMADAIVKLEESGDLESWLETAKTAMDNVKKAAMDLWPYLKQAGEWFLGIGDYEGQESGIEKIVGAFENMVALSKDVMSFIEAVKGLKDNQFIKGLVDISQAAGDLFGGGKGKKTEAEGADAVAKKQKVDPAKGATAQLTSVLKVAKITDKVSEQINKLAKNIVASIKSITNIRKYYDSIYAFAKKINSFSESVISKAASKIKKMEAFMIPAMQQQAIVSALETAKAGGDEDTTFQVGDVFVSVAPVIMDGTKVGKVVVAAMRKS